MNAPHMLPEQAKPLNALAHLRSLPFFDRLKGWFPDVYGEQGVGYSDHAKVTATVAILDDALARLKGNTGERADAAREQIRAARGPIAEALELINSLQANLAGPLSDELQKRITATRAALASALAAKEIATRETVASAALEVEKAWADVRGLERDLQSIYDRSSIRLLQPQLPNLAELSAAKQATAALEAVPAKSIRAADVHGAIEQGMSAPAHVAALWIAYETKPDHELVKWRWRAFAERGQ